MYYIVVTDAGELKIVSNSKAIPRAFSKNKKAENFIESRDFLRARNAYVTETMDISARFKVDV